MNTTETNRVICSSTQLETGGTGYKFNLISNAQTTPAFVIRFNGTVYGYLNRCAHLMLELDWDDAEFFDESKDYLICSNHGAMFEPQSGECINGPCYGASLTSVEVREVKENIVLDDERFDRVEPVEQ